LRPHPSAAYAAIENELPPLEDFVHADVIADCYAGMPADTIRAIAADPLFAVCAHTLDHPYLTLCAPSERRRQIAESTAWLTRLTGRLCTAIAYPAGDYDAGVMEDCVAAGIAEGYAVSEKVGRLPRLERARIGIYSPSVSRLAIKVSAGNALRWCINIG
jgi:peptidoglycan/xylan/chitin deacetylase (PgdA/CDA1 family)